MQRTCLRAVGIEWDKATPADGRDLVLWLRQDTKPCQTRERRLLELLAGSTRSRQQYLGDQYEPRTIRHSNSVLRSFHVRRLMAAMDLVYGRWTW